MREENMQMLGIQDSKPGQHLVYTSSDLSRLDILDLSRNPPVDF